MYQYKKLQEAETMVSKTGMDSLKYFFVARCQTLSQNMLQEKSLKKL